MSHRHFCDFAGHDWECEGAAVRQFAQDSEVTPCMCIKHSVSMDDGDHSECPVELLVCPEHRQDQLEQMGKFTTSDLLHTEGLAESSAFTDKDGKATVGFCLWCNRDFYTADEFWEHTGNGVNAFQSFGHFWQHRKTRSSAPLHMGKFYTTTTPLSGALTV
jgi:hypothetical protein